MIERRRGAMPAWVTLIAVLAISCGQAKQEDGSSQETLEAVKKYPSDIIKVDAWKLMLGNGKLPDTLDQYEHPDYFFTQNDGSDWVVFKAPNGGITSPNSHNTRTEFGEVNRWTPMEGGRLTGTLKVMHVSTSGNAMAAASYSVVVGQIHSGEGHKNEPLKIFYKKFPGHSKGSVFWNYEINTAGENSGRWDYSTPVWGHDMSVVGTDSTTYPAEPEEGIELGEEFSYEVNVYEGIMYLTFASEGHATKTFTKSLIESDFQTLESVPQQTKDLFFPIGQKGTEKAQAYKGELQFFKQGAYNQTNGRAFATNKVWSTSSNTFNGDVSKQYENGSYVEVWFRASSIAPAMNPNQENND